MKNKAMLRAGNTKPTIGTRIAGKKEVAMSFIYRIIILKNYILKLSKIFLLSSLKIF